MRFDGKKVSAIMGKYKYLLLVVAVGLVLLVWPTSSPKPAGEGTPIPAASYSLSDTEEKIGRALAKIEGVGRVEVVLTLKTGVETVYQTDETVRTQQEQDGEQTTRYQSERSGDTIVVPNGSGVQQPVVVKEKAPEYYGALIVCEGGGDSAVVWQIVNAVTALTGISSERITVAKMKE